MTYPPPAPQTLNNLLCTHRVLVRTVTTFLTVSIHHILFLREIYPPLSFLAARAYNYPVRQSRHPAVCTWVNDAVAAIGDQLKKNTVEQVAVCIFECGANRVLERWTFDLRGFPVGERHEHDVPFEQDGASTTTTTSDDEEPALRSRINLADLEAQFRGMLSRMTASAGRLKPLPSGADAPECSFTVTMEVKDDADRPVGRLEKDERNWIAAEPEPFDESDSELKSATDLGPAGDEQHAQRQTNRRRRRRPAPPANRNATTVPVRRLEAGELHMEVWVEESKAKLDWYDEGKAKAPPAGTKTSAKEHLSSEQQQQQQPPPVPQFTPEHGYEDLEPADVNRKPQAGASADYRR